MKKICFITTVSITLKSFLVKTAEYLHEHGGYDITFICSPDEEFQKSLPEYIHYYPIKMGRGINLDGFGAIIKMVRLFKRESFDLVQYSTPNASLYASVAARLSGIPVRLYCQWGIVYVGFSGIKRKIFKFIEKTVCALSTHIRPDSNGNLEFSVSEGLYKEDKGSVVWNGSACGVNLEKFDISKKNEYRKQIREKLSVPENSFVYAFVGRIRGDKGINELLSAFEKIPDAYLMLIGRPEAENSVNAELLTRAKNNSRILFCGYTDVVEQYLSAADCYVLPSYREGFGMGVIEAEAMGVPVIVTDIPGPTDAMLDGKTGKVVPQKDADALYNAMVFMLENREAAARMGEQGHIFASKGFEQKELLGRILEDRRRMLDDMQKE